MQYTIRADYRTSVNKTNGEKYGIYPTLIQSKFRVDEKRPMGKDGKEKAPWSKFFRIQSLFYDCSRTKLYSILDFPEWCESELISLNDQDKNELKTELEYLNEAVTSNFKKIEDLFLQVNGVLSGNEILLRECKGHNQVPLNSNFQKITKLMLKVKELVLQNDKIFWD